MLRGYSLLLLAIILLSAVLSYGRDDLITVTVNSTCSEKSVLVSGGGECVGFLNTESKIVLTTSAPDSLNAAWNVECTNMNREAGEAQAKAWAICSKY